MTNLLNRNETFRGLCSGRGRSIHWPPRSPHLTPLGFCLRILMKGDVYERKVDTLDGWLWHLVCCCLRKETWLSTQMNSTRFSHTSCKVHWGWLWDFWTFIVNC